MTYDIGSRQNENIHLWITEELVQQNDSRSSGRLNGSCLNRGKRGCERAIQAVAARSEAANLHPRWRKVQDGENITSRLDPSSMGHVESRVNRQGPPCKAKYS
ncbi:hypothetical protein H5410_036433 [Solanum commersonii]|uniref:Uncharacterized protein n=1 Tax=Solanum commersonii TaxID=4109 RepID=A0A9J5Y471_SOLCO|nr:hypothetical protein H5410_036433 [Solanum commersonii]